MWRMPTTALAPDLVGEVRGPHTTELETHDSYSRGPQSVGFEGRRELPRDAGKAAQGVRIMTKMGARLGCPRVSARMSLGIKPLAQFERMRTRQQKFETCPRWGANPFVSVIYKGFFATLYRFCTKAHCA